jgi:molybdenum cofactor cytidylyltransferase
VSVVALVLAAGRARRFGSDKRQARLPDGRSLLQAVLQTQLQASDAVIALLRPDDDWGQALCAEWGVQTQVVPQADEGMGRTLAAGLSALLADEASGVGGQRFDAALVVLADMPAVQVETVRALIAAFQCQGLPAWPWHGGRPGHPRLLPRDHWALLVDLSGDEGARHRLDWSRACRVEVPDAGVLIDVDTPADLGG